MKRQQTEAKEREQDNALEIAAKPRFGESTDVTQKTSARYFSIQTETVDPKTEEFNATETDYYSGLNAYSSVSSESSIELNPELQRMSGTIATVFTPKVSRVSKENDRVSLQTGKQSELVVSQRGPSEDDRSTIHAVSSVVTAKYGKRQRWEMVESNEMSHFIPRGSADRKVSPEEKSTLHQPSSTLAESLGKTGSNISRGEQSSVTSHTTLQSTIYIVAEKRRKRCRYKHSRHTNSHSSHHSQHSHRASGYCSPRGMSKNRSFHMNSSLCSTAIREENERKRRLKNLMITKLDPDVLFANLEQGSRLKEVGREILMAAKQKLDKASAHNSRVSPVSSNVSKLPSGRLGTPITQLPTTRPATERSKLDDQRINDELKTDDVNRHGTSHDTLEKPTGKGEQNRCTWDGSKSTLPQKPSSKWDGSTRGDISTICTEWKNL